MKMAGRVLCLAFENTHYSPFNNCIAVGQNGSFHTHTNCFWDFIDVTLAVEGADWGLVVVADVELASAKLSILALDVALTIALTQLESSLFTVW